MKKEYVTVRVEDLIPYANNPRKNEQAVEAVRESIKQVGYITPIVIDENNEILAGHTRLKALDADTVEVLRVTGLTEEQKKKYRLLDNKTGELASWDWDKLEMELQGLDFKGFDFGFITEENVDPYDNSGDAGCLQRDFIAPPFSVLDGRQGYWLERKRWWKAQIQDNAEAREVEAISHNFNRGGAASILDPVLSEIIVRWFTPQDGSRVFDCFAGDTVFGYVAGSLGHSFTGIELRQEQADFNSERTKELPVTYICDDGRNVDKYLPAGTQDLFFSCPPYFDLEVYSDNPSDASNQETYEDFYKILDEAFTKAIGCLADNRFAVVVVGNVRDKKTGGYYNIVGDVVDTFVRNGMHFYNDMIILDPVGSAGIRAKNGMKRRKVVKVHQNVLVFYKGNQDKIKDIFPSIEVEIDESKDEQVELLDN